MGRHTRLSFQSFFYKYRATQSYQQNTASIQVFSFQVSLGTGCRPQKGQRDKFTREPHCLQQRILGVPVCMRPSLISLSKRPDTHGSYVTFMLVESTEISMIPCKDQHWRARTFTHALTGFFNKREKRSTSRHGAGASYQTSHPGTSARGIGFGRSWPFAAFCYRPRLPVRH